MRLRVSAFAVLFVVGFGLPLLGHAQFQEPTQDELHMTADPGAPGAAAVYLYREETVDDNHHFHTFYARIKVLTEKGKELATQSFPYEKGVSKIAGVEGRTIHPDGTVVKLTAKPSDLVDVKAAGFQLNKMVFTLPDVTVGSILEYRLSLEYDDNMVNEPDWQVQQKYYVHKAHYFFYPNTSGNVINDRGEPMDRLMYYISGTRQIQVQRDPQGHYAVDAADVPALPDEDWMPPLNALAWRIQFYYTHVTTTTEFWQTEAKYWQKNADHFANPSKGLKEAATGIVGAGDSEEVKARKLYDAVMKLDNTDFGRAKSQAEMKKAKIKPAKDAEDVWKQKSGGSDQLAELYIALARAAGLTAYPMYVVNRNDAIFDPGYLSMRQFDDYLAVVVVGGKEVFVDPGEKMCPFGLLHWKHTLAGGFREGPNGTTVDSTPANSYTQNSIQRQADLTLAADGSVTGSISQAMEGQDAMHWRQLAITDDPDEVKKQFVESLHDVVPDGVQVEFDKFEGLDDYNTSLVAVVKVSGQLATATGKRAFLPGQFFASHSKHDFVAEASRQIPVDVHYPERITDTVAYKLPDGFAVDSMPSPDVIPWNSIAQLRISSKQENRNIEIERRLEYNYTTLDPKDYGGLHDFYQQVATADQQPLVLRRAN